jgi:hypothetical protein
MSGETREEVEAEIAAIVARLRQEVGHSRTMVEPERPLAARAQAERTWAVTAERPVIRAPQRRGHVHTAIVAPVKRVLRKLMRWYVEPFATQQRSFNLTVLELVDELTHRVDALERERRRDGPEQGG